MAAAVSVSFSFGKRSRLTEQTDNFQIDVDDSDSEVEQEDEYEAYSELQISWQLMCPSVRPSLGCSVFVRLTDLLIPFPVVDWAFTEHYKSCGNVRLQDGHSQCFGCY